MCLPLQDLYAAGEGKFGTDEEKFITILGNRSAEHLRKGQFACASPFGCRDMLCKTNTEKKKKGKQKSQSVRKCAGNISEACLNSTDCGE